MTQVTLKKGTTPAELFDQFAATPRESLVEVEGTVRSAPRANAGRELSPTVLTVVSPAEVPLPLGVVDKVGADLNTRLDHRVLDLRKPEVRRVFELRAALLEGFRQAYTARGFLEVETPKLIREGAEGGATLFSVAYYDGQAYLAQSPQLYKQMLMSAGFERVFEIAPAFRAEPSDTVRHITEFSSMDAEMAYIDGAEDLRRMLEEVVRDALATAGRRLRAEGNPLVEGLPEVVTPFPRVSFRECQERLGQSGREEDLSTEEEKKLGEILVPERRNPFYFITDFPDRVKRSTFYAQRLASDPTLTGYFDLEYRGLELASGGPREHRLGALEQNLRSAGLDPARFAGYLEAFRFGMPTHGGWGFGIDRLVTVLAELGNIREARLFPRDRYRLEP